MYKIKRGILGVGLIALSGCAQVGLKPQDAEELGAYDRGTFQVTRRLTHEAQNINPAWSLDDSRIAFERKTPASECGQIYEVLSNGSELARVSTGDGQNGDPAFSPRGSRLLWSTTQILETGCPKDVEEVFPGKKLYSTYQVYGVKSNGSDPLPLEPGAPKAFNGEVATCRNGQVVFTSDRDGVPNLYRAEMDSFGTLQNVKQITHSKSYNGEASFSEDCENLVWTSWVRDNSVKKKSGPPVLEVWTARADGSQARQVTQLGVSSTHPAFTREGDRVIFIRDTELYWIKLDGTSLERVLGLGEISSFAVSNEGDEIVFSTHLKSQGTGREDLYIARALRKIKQ